MTVSHAPVILILGLTKDIFMYFNVSTIRSQLTLLVAACVLPVWLLATILVFHSYSVKRNQINSSILETAHTTTMVVDRELSSVQAALQALATSPVFSNGDFAVIHRQALELLKSYPGADIIVADSTGQQLVNSYLPYGDLLPKRKNIDTVHSIFASGKPVVTDLYYGAVTRRPMIGIDVPVFQDGKVAYDLGMTFPSDRLAAILTSLKLPKNSYCTLLDSKGIIVARTLNPEKFVGKMSSSGIRKAIGNSSEGIIENTNIEGINAISSFSRSTMSNWTVVVGVPKAIFIAELYQWLALAIGAATTISFLGVIIAIAFARRLERNINKLLGPAFSIGRGESVANIDNLCIKEIQTVASAMVQASELLQKRAMERDEAERQLLKSKDLLESETNERIAASAALLESERMLIHKSRQAAMGEMINNIAHQWRQPLNAVGLYIQSLLIYFDNGEFSREFLKSVSDISMQQIRYMSKTIDDFRNFFKLDKDKTVFSAEEVVQQAVSLVRDGFRNSQIEIVTSVEGNPKICGYFNELCQVLLNIMQNARDALLERKTINGIITISATVEDGATVLVISDNAGGIPEEVMREIFTPYFSTKGPQQGTGIGLFMSKNIIEKNMGGRLSARNIANGAEFRIEV